MRTETSGIRVDDAAAWRPRAETRRTVRVAMRMNHARIARAFGRARRHAVKITMTRRDSFITRAARLFPTHGEHFDLEQQRAVRRNPPRRKSTGAVPLVRGNVQFDDFAHFGAETSLIPTCEENERDARASVSVDADRDETLDSTHR